MNIHKVEEKVYEAVRRGELEIDSQGRIWRVGKRGWNRWEKGIVTRPCRRVRAEHRLTTGYLQVRAMVDSVRHNGLAHRLVWFHLWGSIPDGMTINHRNGVKDDNRPENLELATPSENMRHAVHVLGTASTARQWGEANAAAKLTTAEVGEIRRMRLAGMRLREVADKFGISIQHVSKIALGLRRSRG